MNIKAVINNVRKHGIRGTLEIWQKHIVRVKAAERVAIRKAEFSSMCRQAEDCVLKDIASHGNLHMTLEELFQIAKKDIIPVYSHCENSDELRFLSLCCFSAILQEARRSHEDVRALVVKHILPTLYESLSSQDVTHKVILMEKGPNLSGSFTCLKKHLDKKTDYKVSVHTLGIRAVSDEEYYLNMIAYIADCATAEAIFNCTANEFTSYFTLREETTYIQLWHGCGIIKKIGLSTIDKSFGKSAEGHKEYPLNTNYTYVTLASPEQEWIYEESMGLDASTGVLAPVGISRTDNFFNPSYLSAARKKLLTIVPQARDKKIILYAPTFRGETNKAQGPDKLDIAAMAEKLGDDYVLIVKHHGLVKTTPSIPENLEGSFAFDLTRGHGISINQLLSVSDVLISDYSSVIFEYSLFERPMIFFTYDLEDYNDARGLYYDLEELFPGPIVRTTDEIIEQILHLEESYDFDRIRAFKNRFMSACDGHSTERIVGLIGTKPTPRA